MFDPLRSSPPPISAGRAPSALVASIVIHAIVVAVLFTIHFAPGANPLPDRPFRLTLLAPSPRPTLPPLPSAALLRPLPPPSHPAPRVFEPPPPPRNTQVSVPVVHQPELSLPSPPRPEVAHLELPHFNTAPAPPLKTDNLAPLVGAAPPAARPAPIQAAGFSDISTGITGGTGSRSISTGGFGTARATNSPVRTATFLQSGFGDVAVEQTPRVTRSVEAGTKPVEILAKPHPQYTAEARQLQVEGEVLVEVVFAAIGEARVTRVVRGLGHGLDESALAAAGAIRFRPAERGGEPIDFKAIVHIVFQLAY